MAAILLTAACWSPVALGGGGGASTSLMLPNAPGVTLPWISNGAYDLHHTTPNQTEAMLLWLSLGGRGLDTAFSYGVTDQTATGAAVRQTSVPRDQVFLTTKIPCAGNASGALEYVRQDLAQLGLPYADLVLIHTPKSCASAAEIQATWKGLEQALSLGLTRSIGVSNFVVDNLTAVLETAVTKPAVNQCCMRVGVHDDSTIALCAQHNIVYQVRACVCVSLCVSVSNTSNRQRLAHLLSCNLKAASGGGASVQGEKRKGGAWFETGICDGHVRNFGCG